MGLVLQAAFAAGLRSAESKAPTILVLGNGIQRPGASIYDIVTQFCDQAAWWYVHVCVFDAVAGMLQPQETDLRSV